MSAASKLQLFEDQAPKGWVSRNHARLPNPGRPWGQPYHDERKKAGLQPL